MFSMHGHTFTLREPLPPMDDPENPSQSFPGDVEPYGLNREDVAFVVVGEDMAECLILAIGHDGTKLFEEPLDGPEALASFYCGACEIARGLEQSQLHNSK